MISVLELKLNIQKSLGSYFSTEAHKDTDIVRYINSAIRDIVIQKNFDFNNYTKEVTIQNKGDIIGIPYQIETYFVKKGEENVNFYNFKQYYSDNTLDGVGIFGDKMTSRNPGTYTLYYRGYPDVITKLEGVVDIPQHFFDLVVLKATYFGFMDIRAYNQANNIQSIYTGMIKNIATRTDNKFPLKMKRLNTNKIW